MSNSYGQESDTTIIAGDQDSTADYELNHILSVATAYLESGQIDDAEDLLQDAMEAGSDHPDVRALAQRLDHIRERSTSADSELHAQPSESDVLVNFTSPLPGLQSLSPAAQRYIRAGEGHHAAGQIYSTLDVTALAVAESPDYLPAFVRLAEVQLALGNVAQARDIYETLQRWHEIEDSSPDWIVRSLGISLDPSDTSALLEYAVSLVDAGEVSALEPFVPEAISRAATMNPDAAIELAERYLALRSESLDAQRLFLEVVTATGDVERLIDTTRQIINTRSPLDLLFYRAIAEAATPTGDWLPWIELVASGIRLHPEAPRHDERGLEAARNILTHNRCALISSIVAFAAGKWNECLDSVELLETDALVDPLERFMAACVCGLCHGQIQSPTAAECLLEAVRLAYQPEVEPFARSTKLFGVSAAPEDLLQEYARLDGSESAIDTLKLLRDTNPDRLDIRTALVESYLAVGSINEAVRELRYIAQQHESSSNFDGMIAAMRKISQAVPSNAEMKAKLIEGYLRRGILNEAVEELGKIGALYLERNRRDEAVAAFTKAAEICSALGEFARGNALFGQAVEAHPDNLAVRHAAVAFYLQTGSIARATEQLREVVRIALHTEDRDEAVATLHQIIALAPGDLDAYHRLGEVLTALGEYTQAERVYRRLATLTPDDPVLEAKQSALAVLAATK